MHLYKLINNTKQKIRINRKCTEAIKSTCAQVSTACGLSVEMSRIAVQTTCLALYHHNFYLNASDAMNKKAENEEEEETIEPAVMKSLNQ